MQKEIDEITTELAEYVCDKLCKFPYELNENELIDRCAGCEMGNYICRLLNLTR